MNNNRHKVHVSVNLLLIKENSVLLSLRHNTELSGNCWGLIAGHLEPEESVTSAMIREAKEELEIDIKKVI
ncbi:MAG: NUDIX domain-containing protein [Wolbachia sp.]|uniref:NUDIX domain-containing protein n=1 Tax=Wolbachia endosymbiont (group B) of Xanthorhoe designata TaxID=3066184 RepID=UPI00333FBE8B